jgi:hypothetical protein
MSKEEDMAPEIPAFVKKYVPGVKRGLAWAKYGKEKGEGTANKMAAFKDSREEGFQAASAVSSEISAEAIFQRASKEMWAIADLAMEINNQKNKEERENALGKARVAARKAGLHAAVAAGWEKGWKEGIEKNNSEN